MSATNRLRVSMFSCAYFAFILLRTVGAYLIASFAILISLSVWLLPILSHLLLLAPGFINAGCVALIMVMGITGMLSMLGLFLFSLLDGEFYTKVSMFFRFIAFVSVMPCVFNPAFFLVIAVPVLISDFLINGKLCQVSNKLVSVVLNILITCIEWIPLIVAFVLSMKVLMIIAVILTLVIESIHFFVFLHYSLIKSDKNSYTICNLLKSSDYRNLHVLPQYNMNSKPNELRGHVLTQTT